MSLSRIRNFCIIAHIDHGKSTLADRLIEYTGTVEIRKMKAQLLDSLDLERERGITIKLVPVRMSYKSKDGNEYILNLIDTPGHVDFTYEVSRSIASCEGALLVVDASQGVEAQTVANAYMAVDQGLEIIPVINKIDLPSAHPESVQKEIEEVVGIDADGAILASAKEGIGIQDILERIVAQVPAPEGDTEAPLQALIFDSVYNNYRGVICYVRVVNGTITAGQNVRFMVTGSSYQIEEVGVFRPLFEPVETLSAGEVGYVIANIKTVAEAHVGDTITDYEKPAVKQLPGYKKVKPVVFCGFYPVERDDYPQLRDALEKLTLNDSSITFEPESSEALGFGFRCGFLGLLHMDVAKERLHREFGVDLVATAPNVLYEITTKEGDIIEAHRPSDFPDISEIEEVREPIIRLTTFLPSEFVGKAMQLCQDKRGNYVSMDYLSPERVRLVYDLPLAEFILDFHDKLKSQTRGFASLDYDYRGYSAADLVRVDVLISGEAADAFSFICHKDAAFHRGQAVVRKLKELIPRQLFEVPIQASVGRRVIVRQNVKALRKDVLAKCYGGDISRKRKLLEKQKEGKKRMKQLGKVSIPQEAFLAFLKVDEEDEQ
ncbi:MULTISPECIES: translation elongation factor 4 [Aminobacterium]|jgi:GTP-binding protein LepA|uniref:Elongation factor 4 n=1 Tax=Aminobacterium colombiense (strain DSM 12261 / ALA-1) TaxID=572547 RepID=D5EFF2_AMICL|nr:MULTISPECIES: translation elongation factor 4 [Aminobacterium]MDD2378429.1 translation elongation factor 4 [Aminobacterium colombiense]ADE57284.1 GTP-binding protein LepA [Aminobacterium colombiense DSM 12261]MDD3767403.1 translation elongation factor 4 [Aminobacterium colombiense]MDD4264892.1 translation elongation factor 4 [Aminobacterium colombiense]MDD4586179.1 translation elongation factor 4 [Aminobacterium colombiense]